VTGRSGSRLRRHASSGHQLSARPSSSLSCFWRLRPQYRTAGCCSRYASAASLLSTSFSAAASTAAASSNRFRTAYARASTSAASIPAPASTALAASVAPVIDGLDGPAVELTAREAQLVDLARQGFTDAQIAERLVLSTRTVESHPYRAMRKLGVSARRDL
jgi:DNA-binding NarL/FixJ family response regulator